MSSDPNQMRVGDDERRHVAEQLQEAADARRLTLTEFEERTARAWQAATYAELAALLTDLPGATAPRPMNGQPYTYRPHGTPDPPPPAQPPASSGTGVTALVLGLLGLLIPCLGIPAIVLGALELRSASNGMAIAGFVLGIIGTMLWLAMIVLT